MSVSRTFTVTGTPSSFRLGDLRAILEVAEGLPDDERLTLHVDPGYNQFDRGSSTLSLTREVSS